MNNATTTSPAARPIVVCPVCGDLMPTNKNGTIRKHGRVDTGHGRKGCPGSGQRGEG